ncbi:MAG: DUF4286 family protein [Bacteroidetes bacterium]|nr:DUF4286 family protein [Bacteroidota bacterium]MBS1934834.1 DUF4286 family protein [Bacteroidota bacterium]
MIVYNITMKVNHAIINEWIAWQMQEHIPEIMATKLFDDYKMYHLLEHDDHESVTYTIQYFTSSIERYNQYIKNFATQLRDKAFAKWGNQFAGFRSVMELVQ